MEWNLVVIVLAFCVALGVIASWADAKARFARIEHKLNVLLRHNGIDVLKLSDRVKELARDPAQKIMAIKVYREETGIGLREAKEAVEAFINSQ